LSKTYTIEMSMYSEPERQYGTVLYIDMKTSISFHGIITSCEGRFLPMKLLWYAGYINNFKKHIRAQRLSWKRN